MYLASESLHHAFDAESDTNNMLDSEHAWSTLDADLIVSLIYSDQSILQADPRRW